MDERPETVFRFTAEGIDLEFAASIHRASAAAMVWMVPRIGQVRMICPAANAASMSVWVDPGIRMPSDHSPLAQSCDCRAPNQSTTPAGSRAVGEAAGEEVPSSIARRRMARASAGEHVIMDALFRGFEHCGTAGPAPCREGCRGSFAQYGCTVAV